jgi:antitoxin YefM
MDHINYTVARANFAATLTRVCKDHEPMLITRSGEPSVVMMSLEDYRALEDTASLVRSPANLKRLISAAGQITAGKAVARKLGK